jgi:arylsulfatase A-like enzyme
LEGKPYRLRDEIFSELNYHDYYDPRRAIRTERYKLIVNFTTAPAFMDPSQSWRPQSDVLTPKNRALAYHPHVELFDLVVDPWEQQDVADRPGYAAIRHDLLARLDRHMVETADPLLKGPVESPHHRRAVELLEEAGER